MRFTVVSSVLSLALLSACGNDAAPIAAPATAGAPAAAAPGGSRFELATEPVGAIDVLAAKAKGEAKDVVVVGRLKDTVPGFAAFTLTDVSLKFCGEEGGDEGCPTPWDYCCIGKDKVAAATIAVAARVKGEVIEAKVTELRNMDLVVVRGQLVKSKDGTMRLDADGWFRKARPVVPATIVFPP